MPSGQFPERSNLRKRTKQWVGATDTWVEVVRQGRHGSSPCSRPEESEEGRSCCHLSVER